VFSTGSPLRVYTRSRLHSHRGLIQLHVNPAVDHIRRRPVSVTVEIFGLDSDATLMLASKHDSDDCALSLLRPAGGSFDTGNRPAAATARTMTVNYPSG